MALVTQRRLHFSGYFSLGWCVGVTINQCANYTLFFQCWLKKAIIQDILSRRPTRSMVEDSNKTHDIMSTSPAQSRVKEATTLYDIYAMLCCLHHIW